MSLDPFIKPCKAVLTQCLYLASMYVLGNNMRVYLSLQALQLKPTSMKTRLTSVTNGFFLNSAAFGSRKKSCTAFLKRLVGIKLEGLEIE